MRVSGILSSCLTTETLKRFYQSASDGINSFEDKGIKAKLSGDLMEYAGEVVAEELKRDLEPEEVMLVYNRVRQFLVARGLD